LLLAIVVGAALLVTTILVQRTVSSAYDGIARDASAAGLAALRERARAGGALDDAGLAELLDDGRDEGLRYIAVVDASDQIVASAGTAYGSVIATGTFEHVGDRVRTVRGLGWGRRRDNHPRPAPPPPPTSTNPDRIRLGGLRVVIELEPLVATQLRDDARLVLVAAVIATVVVLGLAWWVARGARVREKLQRELEAGRRLAVLGEMSSVIAHEIRNPLASLKGHAQLLAEALPDDDRSRPKVDRVVADAIRLETLTTDLLDFARSGELRRAPVDPAALVTDAVADVGGSARVDVKVPAEGALGTWSLDAARLRQALVNVVRNAIQVSPPDGRVEVDVSSPATDTLAIAIRDRGPGIPPGEERAIFEPFHTKRVKGIGLGLAIARRMVELHGGSITAGRRDGGGAEIVITVPRAS
jgi:two-component system sensor histidine kinase HydH